MCVIPLNIKYYLCQKLMDMRVILYAFLLLISFGCKPNWADKEGGLE